MRQRFPNEESLVKCGLLRPDEVSKLEDTWWRPILWSMDLLTSQEDVYKYGKHHIMDKLVEWRKRLSDVAAYSVTPVPLVYTQVLSQFCHLYKNH